MTRSSTVAPLATANAQNLPMATLVDSKTATPRSNTPVQSPEEDQVSPAPSQSSNNAVFPPDETKLVGGYKFVLIFVGMLLSGLLVALDQTIVATAIPRIASEFDALDQVTWIASAYFLTQCGSHTANFSPQSRPNGFTYLLSLFLRSEASSVEAFAPNVNTLIVGRAIAGLGAAGIFICCLAILAVITRLEQRPVLFSIYGSIFAFSNVIGPLLGGVITDHISWRWCFYINLPLGAVTILTIMIFIKPIHSTVEPVGFRETMKRIADIDWIGSLLSVGTITSILLPLQWGGVTKPWNDKTIIALFCVFAVLLGAFIAWEWYIGEEKAIMPLSMWTNKAQIGCCLEAFLLLFVILCACCIIVGGALSGAVINVTGRPLPWMIIPPPVAALSCGLIFWKLQSTPSTGFLIAMQLLLGLGSGCGLQNCIIAIQAEYAKKPEMIPQTTSLVYFTQYFGGSLGIAIAGTIFGNRLSSFLAIYAPELPPEAVTAVKQSVEVIKTLDPELRAGVITAYSKALGYAFIIGIPGGILASVAGCLVPNFNIKKLSVQPGAHAA
ncbi:hypothetical protein FRB90_005115 [Tulasnella sp. 427]|nr:hypothetical protein FRB90_005115 [Tulasnella sp. 427]